MAPLLACNLESALGVDDDGSSDGPGTQTTMAPPETESGPATGDGTGSGESSADTSGDTEPLPPADCGGRQLRVATFNVEGVGSAGTPSFEALVDILVRIDADVVCMEEVHETETANLFAMANAAGYPQAIQANPPPAIGGELTNACIARAGLSLVASYSAEDLSSDPTANDVGRDILVTRLDLSEEGGPPCGLGLVSLHLKSGQELQDWFRRQVEAERVVQAVARYRADHPDDPMVILGDLNENIDDPALGTMFDQVPVGLPDSYHVGSDIVFPLTYQPFTTFEGQGFTITDATQEDSDRDETWADLVRLDYVMVSAAQGLDAEVYNACRDNGVDDGPAGGSVVKAGDPLACELSELASDHFPVLVDLSLP
ncbi:MAG: endonuclease/exonuclease/phosphatase family protein [Myxococcales bacterium]|nr:endonuclease/exonuclease/phosphatase family protein [Myxococcales bacterium]MCB9716454.1 endonuclease/exonuclease/phosphatase family protein [Myxococcales bacterium]